jgi:hypothetical protein
VLICLAIGSDRKCSVCLLFLVVYGVWSWRLIQTCALQTGINCSYMNYVFSIQCLLKSKMPLFDTRDGLFKVELWVIAVHAKQAMEA